VTKEPITDDYEFQIVFAVVMGESRRSPPTGARRAETRTVSAWDRN